MVRAAGLRMYAPERTGGPWHCGLGYAWDGSVERKTAEETLDEALCAISERADAEVNRLRESIAAEEKRLATCASLRAKLAATITTTTTTPEGSPE